LGLSCGLSFVQYIDSSHQYICSVNPHLGAYRHGVLIFEADIGNKARTMPSGSSSSKHPKAAEIASDAKRNLIPQVRSRHANKWCLQSFLYPAPLEQLQFHEHPLELRPPTFLVLQGDPVDTTIWYRGRDYRAGFICPANEKKAGGEWETAVEGVEERFCRRSTLSANLSANDANYPIPMGGAIFSAQVVVFRGPHDTYDKWSENSWTDLPVTSIPPQRWPKLRENGTQYSFSNEREIVRNKLQGALRICLYNQITTIVIGDWGLGKNYRNPPQELAELWREVFLFDPDLRGRFPLVIFAFEDPMQSTVQLIQDDLEKQKHKSRSKGSHSSSGSSSSKSKSKGKSKTASSSSRSSAPTDMEIFQAIFDHDEIQRVITEPDARYDIGMLTM
jgi:hypothetical protein